MYNIPRLFRINDVLPCFSCLFYTNHAMCRLSIVYYDTTDRPLGG